MKNYKEIKDEVLACVSFMGTVLGTLVWSANTNYVGLTEDESWFILAMEGLICFGVITGALYGAHWLAHKINKHATRHFVVKVLRKYSEITDMVFADA